MVHLQSEIDAAHTLDAAATGGFVMRIVAPQERRLELSIGAPALLALLFGLIRKKGFWIIFLVFIISIAVGAALPIVL